MIRLIGKLTLAAMLAAAVAVTPATVSAQTNSTTTTNATKPAAARPRTPSFTGKIVTIDSTNKTFTAGVDVKRVYQVTSATKLTKSSKPAAFDDFAVGDNIRISYTTNTVDGKFEAKTISTVPPRPAKKPGGAATGPAAPAPVAPPATAPKQP